jgi:hypothetical protein
MKTLQETFDSIKFPSGTKIHIPAILLDGYTDRLRELGARPPTITALNEFVNQYQIGVCTKAGNTDPASMVISDDLRQRVINLDLKAIKKANQILPGWVVTLPEIQAEIGRCQQTQTNGDPTGKAEDFIKATMFPRSLGSFNRKQKLIVQREGYSLYHSHVYPAAKLLCAILDREGNADPAGLIHIIRKAVNRLLANSDKQDFEDQSFFVMYFLRDRKKAGLKNQFTTCETILDCIRHRDQYTPQRLAHTVMGIAFDRHPDVMKKEIAAQDFSGVNFDIQKPLYFKTQAKIFCDYMLALK